MYFPPTRLGVYAETQRPSQAQELGSTERTAELAQTRPQGPKLLSEVCRRVREAGFATCKLLVRCMYALAKTNEPGQPLEQCKTIE